MRLWRETAAPREAAALVGLDSVPQVTVEPALQEISAARASEFRLTSTPLRESVDFHEAVEQSALAPVRHQLPSNEGDVLNGGRCQAQDRRRFSLRHEYHVLHVSSSIHYHCI